MNAFVPVLKSIKRTELFWRYVSNLRPTVSYGARGSEQLTLVEREIVAQLDGDGIAVTSIDALVDSLQATALERSVARLLENMTAEIAELKRNAGCEDAIGSKTFNLEMLGGELTFDPDDVLARFALNKSFLNIANAYLRMVAKLRYYNVWYTAASASSARESQLWHFDREDNYILKAFLYLDDVDEGAGPFTYAPGTHKKGKYRSIDPEHFLEGGVRRTTDEQMKAVFPEERWVRGIGKKGTLIFADTRGFHKGGEARTRDRLMYTCMYTSQASQSKVLLKLPSNGLSGSLLANQLRALGLK